MANKLPPPAARKNISAEETLRQAQIAYNQKHYEKAFNLTGSILDNPSAAILHIRALANFSGSLPAEKVLSRLLNQHADCFELQYLHGQLLLDLGLLEPALAALNRCLWLDSQAILAHFHLALVHKRLCHKVEAQRSFRKVVELCNQWQSEAILPYGDGEPVQSVSIKASAELNALSLA